MSKLPRSLGWHSTNVRKPSCSTIALNSLENPIESADRIQQRVQTIAGIDMPDVSFSISRSGGEDAKEDKASYAKESGNPGPPFQPLYKRMGKQRQIPHTLWQHNGTRLFFKNYMGLTLGGNSKYAKNRKGKMAKVCEEGWAGEANPI